MTATDKVENFVDYATAAKALPGLDASQVQHAFGSPDDIERLASGQVVWRYNRRFCEADARCIYKQVSVTFADRKFVSIQPR